MSRIFQGLTGTIFSFALLFLITPISFAESNTLAPQQISPEKMQQSSSAEQIEAPSVLIATVNIYDAHVTKQDGRTISTSFLLSNREGAQPNLKYGAEILKLGENGIPVDLLGTFLSPDTVALRANENLPLTFTFTIPPTVEDGIYLVAPIANNASGMSLALAQAGNITLKGGLPSTISIKECSLRIHNGDQTQKFTVDQGVDIGSDEMLDLVCSMKNTSQGTQVLSPKFTTYRRSISSGTQVSVPEMSPQNVTLQAGEEKDITVTLPKASLPQAYDIDTVFTDQSGTPVARDIIVHYVLRGASGTLQNILLDKDSYQAGDTAMATITFSGSADAFPDARGSETGTDFGTMNLEVTLRSADGKNCSVPKTETFSREAGPQQKLSLSVTKDCQWPTLLVRLMRSDTGALLDEVSANLAPVGSKQSIMPAQETSSSWISQWAFASLPSVIVMIVLVGLLVLLGVKLFRSKNIHLGIFIFALLMAGFMGGETARADSFLYRSGYAGLYMSYNLDKPAYSAGDTLTATASGTYLFSCGNRPSNVDTYVSPNQAIGSSYVSDSDGYGYILRCGGRGCWASRTINVSGTPYFASMSFTIPPSGWTAPSAYATFDFYHYISRNGRIPGNIHSARNIWYALSLGPVDGTCGSANGVTASTAPSSSLCATGTPTAVAGPGGPVGSWNWTCSGSNGGSDANCAAPYINLKICENSCDSGLDRTKPPLPSSFAVDGGSTHILKACYNSAVSCTDASGDVTSAALWNDTNAPGNTISFPSKGTLLAASTTGTENFNVTYSSITQPSTANVTCVPLTCSSAKSVTDTYCQDTTKNTGVSNGCSGTLTCPGTRTYCDTNYHEVAP